MKSLRPLLFAAALLAILASSEGYLLAAATAPTHPRHEAQRVHAEPGDLLLDPALARPYFQTFVQQERSFLGQPVAPLDWAWFASNIPWLDLPDQELERTYYFRWYAFRKHLHETPDGAMIDEFLDPVPWAGRDNSISAAASMHLREARWLRTAAFAQQSARFWFLPGSDPRRYSFPVAASVLDVSFAQGDPDFAISLLPDLVRNYQAWEDTHQDANGLFWQIDDRDGMEGSIGGSGYRVTINSYLFGDANALATIAAMAGQDELAAQYSAKAQSLRTLIETFLWDPEAGFYETVRRDSASRDPVPIESGTAITASRPPPAGSPAWVGVRELMGFLPWYYDDPPPDHDAAWKQLDDPAGFRGLYGPTTAERRSPRFNFSDAHECLWNGPSWPFATTQTLVAMANLLNGPPQPLIDRQDYFHLLSTYAHSQRIQLADGSYIPWIDEDLDADTGEWIARDILERRHELPRNRGRYYNHSGFADLIVTGLLGLRPAADDTVTIHPLVPPGLWDYFAIDGLPYHGHLLTLFYDKAGTRYRRGAGLHLLADGVPIASTSELKSLTARLPARLPVALR